MTGTLTGAARLARLALRRDRLLLPLWLVATVGIVVASYRTISTLYPDPGQRAALVRSIAANPTLRTLTGQLYDGTTVGGITSWRSLGWGAVALSLMSIFVVTRHTRAEEETGRLELLGSAAVGRGAPLVAALAVAWSADLLAGVLVGVGLAAQGAAVASAAAFAAALAVPAMVFAGLAAVAAQVGATARAANALATGTLGVAFLLRAVADGSSTAGLSWLGWLSPIGWSQRVRPFAGDRWSVVAVVAVAAVALAAVAVALNSRRDLGAATWSGRPGRRRAGRRSNGALALAWRLQRASLLGWLVGVLVLGMALGSLAPGIAQLAGTSPQISAVLERLGGVDRLTDAYLSAMLGVIALLAAGYGVSAATRLRAEETSGRVEPLLSTAVSRTRWLCGHVAIALGGAGVLVLLAAVAVGGSFAVADSGGAGPGVGALVVAAAGQLPAIWVTVGVTVLLFGLGPQLVGVGWGVFAVFVIVDLFGPTLRLPSIVLDVSPFTHIPAYPLDRIGALPVGILLILAAALGMIGGAAFRRRDLRLS